MYVYSCAVVPALLTVDLAGNGMINPSMFEWLPMDETDGNDQLFDQLVVDFSQVSLGLSANRCW